MTITWRGALVGALPLALVVGVDPGGLAPFGPAKALALFVLVPAAAALWMRGSVRVARSAAIAWLVFLAVAGLAAAFGVDRLYAWIGTPERHFGWLAWLLCALAFVIGQQLDARAARIVALASAAAIAVAGAWAVVELVGWHPIALAGAGDRPVGPLGSSAYLGAAALLLGPVAIGVAASRRIAVGAAGLAAIALVASGARAAWAGALVAGIAWLLARGAGKRVVAVALLGAIGAAFAFGVAGRVSDLLHDKDGGVRGRLDEWRVAARVVGDHPAVGVGPEGYRIAFGEHADAAYEQQHGRDPLPDRAHNALLDVAATTGLGGALAYVVLLAVTGRIVVRALRRGQPMVAGIAAGLIGYAAQSLVLFPVAELDPVAWLLAGIVVTAAGGVPTRELRVPRLVPLLGAATAGVALVAGGLDLVADRSARTTIAALGVDRLPGGDGPRRLRPDVLRYHLLAARAAEARGTPSGFTAALADLDRGLAISPQDPVARAERARVQLERARLTGNRAHVSQAKATLERLVADDPVNAEAWLRLGVAAALAGDDPRAEQAWRRADRLAPRSGAAAADLALAYARQGRWSEARTAARRALRRDPGNEHARDVLRRADEADGTNGAL